MTFLTILLVLFIDRALWDAAPYRQHDWIDRYLTSVNRNARLNKSPWGIALIILPLLLLIGWLQVGAFPALGGFFEMLFGGAVLLFSLGPSDLGRDVSRYLNARTASDQDTTRILADQFSPNHSSENSDQMVVHGILIGACHRLIGPLVWFALFGAVGAAAYRLAQIFSSRLPQEDAPSRLAKAAARLAMLLDWMPTRITAAGYAVAGNFDAVAAAWKNCTQEGDLAECADDGKLLVETGYAALEQAGERPASVMIEDALALVWRNLTLWVVFAGTATLLASL